MIDQALLEKNTPEKFCLVGFFCRTGTRVKHKLPVPTHTSKARQTLAYHCVSKELHVQTALILEGNHFNQKKLKQMYTSKIT